MSTPHSEDRPQIAARIMADRSNFWKIVDRTKPSKLRAFPESELRDCEGYFLEIQSHSTLPPNEIITASERLALIHSEIDLRHADAKHRQTQRLARWAIAFGMVSMAAAMTSGVAQFFAYKPTHETLVVTAEPIVATLTPRELLTPTQELTATSPAAMLELSAASPTAMLEVSSVPPTLTPELTPAPMPRGRPADIKPEYVEETTPPPKKPLAQKFTPIKTPQAAGPPGTMSISTAKALATYAPIPQYPYEARSRQITGRGVCVVEIDSGSGSVRSASMASSTGNPMLDNAAVSAFRRWRFKPGSVSKVRIPITFTMTGAQY